MFESRHHQLRRRLIDEHLPGLLAFAQQHNIDASWVDACHQIPDPDHPIDMERLEILKDFLHSSFDLDEMRSLTSQLLLLEAGNRFARAIVHQLQRIDKLIFFWKRRVHASSLVLFTGSSPYQWLDMLRGSNSAKQHYDQLKLLRRDLRDALSLVVTMFDGKHLELAQLLPLCEQLIREEEPSTQDPLLRSINCSTNELPAHIASLVDLHEIPLWVSRNWLPVAGGSLCLLGIAAYTLTHQDALSLTVRSWRDAMAAFARNRIIDPLQGLWRSVRYDERKFEMASEEAFHADKESLGRMVVSYVDKLDGDNDLQVIADQAQRGNINAVMPAYEDEMEHPMRSAVFGDLIQLLLIQVQKAKVDIATTMQGVDNMMHANEVNFQLMALIPSVLLMRYLAVTLGSAVLSRNPYHNTQSRVRNSMGRLLRVIGSVDATDSTRSGKVACLAQCVSEDVKSLPRHDNLALIKVLKSLVWNCSHLPAILHSIPMSVRFIQ